MLTGTGTAKHQVWCFSHSTNQLNFSYLVFHCLKSGAIHERQPQWKLKAELPHVAEETGIVYHSRQN